MPEDQTITCKDCGKEFTWSKEEQAYYSEKGFKNVPQRCLECREKARGKREASQPKFNITCADCGKKTEVPFEAEKNQPIYCQECFDKKRAS